jgi:hypothetical protein
MKDYLLDLRTIIWRTAGSRYNAARRLKRKELFSTISLTFFSVMTICLAVVQKNYSSAILRFDGLDTYITTLSVLAGVFLLAISLMEWGARNGSNADALYKNAEELNALQRLLGQQVSKVAGGVEYDWDKCEGFAATYEDIQGRYDVNHGPLDDMLFLARHRSAPEFVAKKISCYRAFGVRVLWFMSSIWYYLLFWVVSVIALIPLYSRLNFF